MNDYPNKLKPIIFGSVTMILFSLIPLLNLFCCAGIFMGGVAGVIVYNKELNKFSKTLNYKDGVFIGVLCGIMSGVILTGFNILMLMYSKNNPFLEMSTYIETFEKYIPDISKEFEQLSQEYNKYGFSPTLLIFSFIINMIIYPLFGSLGALLAITIIKRKSI
jgi:hypothetical protein